MSKITYYPRIPTSRKVLPSQYQRIRGKRDIILNLRLDTMQFMRAMWRVSEVLEGRSARGE